MELEEKYRRALWALQDIAALIGTTKRKQAGCEIALHTLAQIGEPKHADPEERSELPAPKPYDCTVYRQSVRCGRYPDCPCGIADARVALDR